MHVTSSSLNSDVSSSMPVSLLDQSAPIRIERCANEKAANPFAEFETGNFCMDHGQTMVDHGLTKNLPLTHSLSISLAVLTYPC